MPPLLLRLLLRPPLPPLRPRQISPLLAQLRTRETLSHTKVVRFGHIVTIGITAHIHSILRTKLRRISRHPPQTSVTTPTMVSIGMAQREEELLETTEKLWTHATSLELVNVPGMHLVLTIQQPMMRLSENEIINQD